MNRLCIFAHYDKHDVIDKYVVEYLRQLHKMKFKIIFVSVSKIKDTSSIRDYVMEIILRDNVGYDFMSWQKGIQSVLDLSIYDEVIFCNDSCYGPIYPLDDIFNIMAKRNLDAWGITDSNQISYHIQSYFLVFTRKVFISEEFNNFMNSISVEKNKEIIVEKYEVGLSKMLISSGFTISSFIKYKDIINSLDNKKIYRDKIFRIANILKSVMKDDEVNFMTKVKGLILVIKKYFSRIGEFSLRENSNIKFVAWKELLECGDPFIKVMLLRDNPSDIKNINDYETLIRTKTSYDVSLINNHLNRVKNNA